MDFQRISKIFLGARPFAEGRFLFGLSRIVYLAPFWPVPVWAPARGPSSALRENAPRAPAAGELMIAFASAKWPLPIVTPLKARFSSSAEYGTGFGCSKN